MKYTEPGAQVLQKRRKICRRMIVRDPGAVASVSNCKSGDGPTLGHLESQNQQIQKWPQTRTKAAVGMRMAVGWWLYWWRWWLFHLCHSQVDRIVFSFEWLAGSTHFHFCSCGFARARSEHDCFMRTFIMESQHRIEPALKIYRRSATTSALYFV